MDSNQSSQENISNSLIIFLARNKKSKRVQSLLLIFVRGSYEGGNGRQHLINVQLLRLINLILRIVYLIWINE